MNGGRLVNGRNALYLVAEDSECQAEQYYILSFMVEKIVTGLHSQKNVATHNHVLNQSLLIVNGRL